jgi:hypothetical protein
MEAAHKIYVKAETYFLKIDAKVSALEAKVSPKTSK